MMYFTSQFIINISFLHYFLVILIFNFTEDYILRIARYALHVTHRNSAQFAHSTLILQCVIYLPIFFLLKSNHVQPIGKE